MKPQKKRKTQESEGKEFDFPTEEGAYAEGDTAHGKGWGAWGKYIDHVQDRYNKFNQYK